MFKMEQGFINRMQLTWQHLPEAMNMTALPESKEHDTA